MAIINTGDDYRYAGEYEQAIAEYQNAVRMAPKNEEAYIKILNIYVNNMDNAEVGLETVASYINSNKALAKNNRLLYQMGMTYFDLQSYDESLKYFRMIDEKSDEYGKNAQHYIAMAMAMSEPNPDYTELAQDMAEFESNTAGMAAGEAKFMNYKILGMVYTRNIGNIPDAAESAVRVLSSALNDLNKNGSALTNSSSYYYYYNLYLITAYESMAAGLTEEDPDAANSYYYEALNCSDNVLSQINKDENATTYASVLVQKAEIYVALGDKEKAITTYQEAESQMGAAGASV